MAQWILDERIKPPNSARGTQLDLGLTPWLSAPCEAVADDHNREVVLIMPTGAGKTSVIDATILHSVKEDPGSMLVGMQTDPEADSYWDERAEPQLLALEGVGEMVVRLPRGKRKKGELVMPHMTLWVKGANITNFQRKSVRYVLLDEVWQIKHGLVAEARARHHDRWNARVVLVSQGGTQNLDTDTGRVPTELWEAWERTNRMEWCFTCPHCQLVQPWKWRQLKYDDCKKPDGSMDVTAIAASVRYRCAGEACQHEFADHIATRRALANSGTYVEQNPNFLRVPANHVGYHCNALTLYYVAWATLVIEWLKANASAAAGDYSALIVFIQKRLAEFWKDLEDSPAVILGGAGYSLADYNNGETWEGELYRFMLIDRQRDHFHVLARAFMADGSSRMLGLWLNTLTIESVREIQKRMKIIDDFTFEDAQYETGQTYDDCAKYGWVALHGSKEDGFIHRPLNRKPVMKFFSPLKRAAAPGGGYARYIFWSNEKVKDLLAKSRGGRGAPFDVADDAGADYQAQMNSEIKKDVIEKVSKKIKRRWVKIGSRQNHCWDLEAMGHVAALIKGVIGSDAEELTEEAPASMAE